MAVHEIGFVVFHLLKTPAEMLKPAFYIVIGKQETKPES